MKSIKEILKFFTAVTQGRAIYRRWVSYPVGERIVDDTEVMSVLFKEGEYWLESDTNKFIIPTHEIVLMLREEGHHFDTV